MTLKINGGTMRNLFVPDYMFSDIYKITPEFIKSLGVSTVVLDIDNTLVTYAVAEPTPEVIAWVRGMQESGLSLCIASNNHGTRVEKLNEKLGLFYMCSSAKPSRKAVRKACEHFGTKPSEVAVIGDQIFTDVLCASRAGAVAILVTPIPYNENLFFRFKRVCEKPFIRAYKRREKADLHEKKKACAKKNAKVNNK
jgi:HAD superfamily phosphatase (TIGR01668 family)